MTLFKLGLKILLGSRKEKFISFNGFLALLAITLSTMVLIVVIAVMSGFGSMLKDKLMTFSPHLVVRSDVPIPDLEETKSTLLKNAYVKGVSPFIYGHAVLLHDNQLYGISVKGINPETENTVIPLNKHLVRGDVDLSQGEIIIGRDLALQMNASIGDTVTILAATKVDNDDFPDEIDFRIKGVFECGLYDLDATQTFIHMSDARLLYGFRPTHIHGYGVFTTDAFLSSLIKQELQADLDAFYLVETWLEKNKTLFSALKTEKSLMFLILSLTVLISSLNIVSTLVMLVMEKTRDIGILKAIGFSQRQILKAFLFIGILLGMTGTLAGFAGSILFLRNIDALEKFCYQVFGFEFFPKEIYNISRIPTELNATDTIYVILLGLVVSVMAAFYPAFKASITHPSRVLRNDI